MSFELIRHKFAKSKKKITPDSQTEYIHTISLNLSKKTLIQVSEHLLV